MSWALSAEEQEKLVRWKISQVSVDNAENENAQNDNAGNTTVTSTTSSSNDENPSLISAAEKSLWQKLIRKGLIENQNDLEVQRSNPNSPLYYVKTFEELNLKPELLKGIQNMGFIAPSKIQETTLPAILADPPSNLIAQSQSGTGKTAAFVIGMLTRVDASKPYPQVLLVCPTYELAVQTSEVANVMATYMPGISFAYALRGEEVPGIIREHIVIGTPGKLVDWALKGKYFDLSKIVLFVLDEADIMISLQGHYEQVHRIRKHLNPSCQMLLFSATYGQDVMKFAESIVKNPIILRLKREEQTLDNIKQYYVLCCDEEYKYRAITNIYGGITIGQAIIFVQTRRAAKWLADKMEKDGHSVGMLSAELSVDERIKVLDNFRKMTQKVLITTNVLSRGIDIESVNIVVNFHMPVDLEGRADCETYLHRIGRTGRFGKSGIAVNLIQTEQDHKVLETIREYFGKPIIALNVENADEIEGLE